MLKKHHNKKEEQNKKTELAKKIAATSKPIKKGYSKVEQLIVKVFTFFSDWFDRIVFNQKYSKIVALSLSIVLVFSITSKNDKNLLTNRLESAIKLNDIQVVSNINNNIYEVKGLPKKVTVTITGDTNSVQSTSSKRENLQVIADLSNLDEGSHLVKLTPVNFSGKVNVEVEPREVTVTIKKKVSKSFDVGYDFVNDSMLNKKYVLSEPKLSQNDVIVRGSEDTINQISFVKALIDVNGVNSDFTESVPVVAYNQKGELMDVDIIPKTIKAEVKVSSPYKQVPLSLKIVGNSKNDKMVDSYKFSDDEIVIYGPKKKLENITSVGVEVDIKDLDKNTTITTPITLPDGVQDSDISKVSVDLKMGKKEEKVFDDIPIKIVNNEGKTVNINGDNKVSVKVYGTANNLNKLKKEDIVVTADVDKFDSAGNYDADLTLEISNPLVYGELQNSKINVTIGK